MDQDFSTASSKSENGHGVRVARGAQLAAPPGFEHSREIYLSTLLHNSILAENDNLEGIEQMASVGLLVASSREASPVTGSASDASIGETSDQSNVVGFSRDASPIVSSRALGASSAMMTPVSSPISSILTSAASEPPAMLEGKVYKGKKFSFSSSKSTSVRVPEALLTPTSTSGLISFARRITSASSPSFRLFGGKKSASTNLVTSTSTVSSAVEGESSFPVGGPGGVGVRSGSVAASAVNSSSAPSFSSGVAGNAPQSLEGAMSNVAASSSIIEKVEGEALSASVSGKCASSANARLESSSARASIASSTANVSSSSTYAPSSTNVRQAGAASTTASKM